jgi:hypothetical protein
MPAIEDTFNGPLTATDAANFSNSTFVDDNAVLACHVNMHHALQQSLISAFLIFGFPGEDQRRACLQDDKWEHTISHIMLYLGFLINSQEMTVSWPYYKQAELHHELTAILSQRT